MVVGQNMIMGDMAGRGEIDTTNNKTPHIYRCTQPLE